jgi:flagellin-like protein
MTLPKRSIAALGGLTLLAAGLRAPFMGTGVGADEGGYAFVAHEWANGAHLYRDLFVDRPQGLMVLYRGLTDIAYHAWAIRLGAVLAGTVLALLVTALGWMLHSRAAGIAAGVIFAVAGLAPGLEGFTLEGELAAAVPAAAAIACAVRWRAVANDRWLIAAGLCGSSAVLIKQSGIDGLLVALAIVLVAAAPAAVRLRRMALLIAGALPPLAAATIHGLSIGWSDYWLGVYSWRAHENASLGLGARVDGLFDEIPHVAPDLWALAVVAALGLVVCALAWRRLWIAPVWLLACFVAINIGGLYLPHYFLQLIPPLAVLGGIAAAVLHARSRVAAIAVVALAIAPVAMTLVDYATMSPAQREKAIRWKRRYDDDVKVADFIRAHSTRGDRVLALPSRADLYFLADRLPPIPYLWEHTPLVRPSTIRTLYRKLSRPGRPKFVLVVENARNIDRSGRLTRVVARNYRDVWRPPGVRNLRVLLARGTRL